MGIDLTWGAAYGNRVLTSLLAFTVGCTCGTTEKGAGADEPDFTAAVPADFVLDQLRRMTGLEELAPGPAELANESGYAFVLPEAGTPREPTFVVTLDYHEVEPAAGKIGEGSDPAQGRAGAADCLMELQDLPFSAGVDGSSRAVQLTMGRYVVKIAVFEKLRDGVDGSLDLRDLASQVSDRYCAAVRGSSRASGDEP